MSGRLSIERHHGFFRACFSSFLLFPFLSWWKGRVEGEGRGRGRGRGPVVVFLFFFLTLMSFMGWLLHLFPVENDPAFSRRLFCAILL